MSGLSVETTPMIWPTKSTVSVGKSTSSATPMPHRMGAGHGEGGRRVQAADPGVRLAALLLGLCFCNRKCFNLLNKLKIL